MPGQTGIGNLSVTRLVGLCD